MSSQVPTLDEIRDFKGKYPKQIWYLFGTEMWERFCFYGLRGMLTVFMVTQLGLDDKAANLQYGSIQAFVYAFTFIGGLFADKILGFQKSLFWGATLMIAGGFVIAFAPTGLFYIGICFNIIGTGFFKPNISTMVGQLYHEGDARRDAGFGLFYSGINLGAFLGGLLMVWIGKGYSWRLAFALVGVVMIISLINFVYRRKALGPIGLSPLHPDMPAKKRKGYEIAVYIGSLLTLPLIYKMVTNTGYTDLFMYVVGPAALAYLLYEMRGFFDADGARGNALPLFVTAALVLVNGALLVLKSLEHDPGETVRYAVFGATMVAYIWAIISGNAVQRKLHAALIFIIFSIFFWAFFEQSGGSLSLFALYNLKDHFLGVAMDPNSVNNAANSLFVIAFSALLGLLWLWLNKRRSEPNSVVKFGLGFLFLGAGFYIFKSTFGFADPDGTTSLEVFTMAWLVITFGELCLSPIGLSLMTKLAPLRIHGLMMGMWFLASAYGQYLTGILGAGLATTGEYRITVTPPTTEATSDPRTIAWQDTSENKAVFERMDILVMTKEADTSKFEWKTIAPNTTARFNMQGDTVAWRMTEITNDGSEQVALPGSLIAREDADLSVAPRPLERLKTYTDGYGQLGLYALIAGAMLILISPLVRKLMRGVH